MWKTLLFKIVFYIIHHPPKKPFQFLMYSYTFFNMTAGAEHTYAMLIVKQINNLFESLILPENGREAV